jgi:hypothetical protein
VIGFEYLGAFLRAALTDLSTFCVGILFVFFGWIRFARNVNGTRPTPRPLALIAFTASVCLTPVMVGICWVIREELSNSFAMGMTLGAFLLCVLTCGSVVLLLASVAALRWDLSPSRGIVKMGAIVLSVINAGGIIAILIEVYKTHSH